MLTICTQKFFIFRNDQTAEICSVPRSNTITMAKQVPDWVKDTDLFALGVGAGEITVVGIPGAEAKVQVPVQEQVSVSDAVKKSRKTKDVMDDLHVVGKGA